MKLPDGIFHNDTKDAAGNVEEDADENPVLVPDWGNMIWPAIKDIRAAGKQVLIFSRDQHGGEYIWKRPSANDLDNSRAKSFVYRNESASADEGSSPAAPDAYRCLSREGAKVFDFTRFDPDNKPGFFTVLYEARSLFDVFCHGGAAGRVRGRTTRHLPGDRDQPGLPAHKRADEFRHLRCRYLTGDLLHAG